MNPRKETENITILRYNPKARTRRKINSLCLRRLFVDHGYENRFENADKKGAVHIRGAVAYLWNELERDDGRVETV